MRRCLQCDHSWGQPGWTCPRCGSQPATLDGYPSFAPELARSNTNYDPAYFSTLAAIDRTHFWFRSRGAMVVWALGRNSRAPQSIMEIGCGVGGMLARFAAAFPGASLTGSDIYTSALPHAALRVPSATLLQMDATAIPFEEEFDVIAALDVIEHIERDDLALAGIHRALRPGGSMVLTVPHDPRLWSSWDELSHHQRRYTEAELVRRVRAAGFEVEQVMTLFALVYPLMRITRGRRRAGAVPADELRISGAVNFVLGRVMGVERLLMRSGVRFPFGGSLILVGHRV